MPTRMDRYREEREEPKEFSRLKKNEELYKNIYADREYSNIEGIASISKNNEIDLDKLKEMLKRKEEREERKYKSAKITPIQKLEDEIEKQKEYDINEVIDRAKKENREDNSHRSLKSVDLEFLKSLDMQDLKAIKEDEEAKGELKELLQTITSTSTLHKLGDKELSLEMLSELKEVGNTQTDTKEDLKEAIKKEEPKEETSFFTTNNLFKKEDFESLKENNLLEQNNKTTKIIMVVLGFVAFALAFYLIVKLWKG